MTNDVHVPSPCVKICVVDTLTDFCIGCGRSRAEIQGWLHYSNEERGEIVSQLDGRLTSLTKRPRRGRAKRLQQTNNNFK